MVKGALDPGFDYLIRPGKKGTGAGSALDPGDVVITDTGLTPDGWQGSDMPETPVSTPLAAGVNVNRVEDAETDLVIVLKGPVRVKAEEAITVGSFVKTGIARGVAKWIQGTDSDELKKGFFSGLHDKPVTGTPAVLQDPQTLKDAALNDIIIVDWFGGTA